MYFRGRSPRKYVQYEGDTYPMHCKNHETAVLYNRLRKATAWRWNVYTSMYCTLAAQRKVPYARRCSYSSIA